MSETGIVRTQRVENLLKEANKLVAIFGASLRALKANAHGCVRSMVP